MSLSLTSVLGKIMRQFLLKAASEHVKDKVLAGKSQPRFNTDVRCLTNVTAFCDGTTGSGQGEGSGCCLS